MVCRRVRGVLFVRPILSLVMAGRRAHFQRL